MEKKNRVKDRTTTTGTGTVSLSASAPAGYRTFVSAVTDGEEVKYLIESEDQTEWEIGIGTFTDGDPDTLSRDTVINSSNSDSLVDFSAGTKEVTLIFEAGDIEVFEVEHNQDGSHNKAGTMLTTGWTPVDDEWEFSSVDDPVGVIAVPAGAAAKYSNGMRITFSNGGNTIYGIIVAVSDTSITFLHEIDPTDSQALYLMADSAITNVYFSPHKAPFGFPLEPTKWTVEASDTSSRTQATPTSNVWYNLGTITITIPIGIWDVSYNAVLSGSDDTGNTGQTNITLSTANNSESDADMTHSFLADGPAAGTEALDVPVFRKKFLTLTAKDVYYLNAMATASSAVAIGIRGDRATTIIRATCAYL